MLKRKTCHIKPWQVFLFNNILQKLFPKIQDMKSPEWKRKPDFISKRWYR